MLNQAYSNRKFFENISQTTNISALKQIFEAKNLEISVHFESNLPISLCWDVASNSLTGAFKITIFPKLVINGELYEAPFRHDLVIPPSFDGLESALLSALKESLRSVARVWD